MRAPRSAVYIAQVYKCMCVCVCFPGRRKRKRVTYRPGRVHYWLLCVDPFPLSYPPAPWLFNDEFLCAPIGLGASQLSALHTHTRTYTHISARICTRARRREREKKRAKKSEKEFISPARVRSLARDDKSGVYSARFSTR